MKLDYSINANKTAYKHEVRYADYSAFACTVNADDAKLIAKMCNAHYALVAALSEMADDYPVRSEYGSQIHKRAVEALANAAAK